MIVVLHSGQPFRILDGSKVPFPLVQGVSFFFVLSGFILTYVYPSLGDGSRIRDFYIARIARIWPAYATSFVLVLLFIPSSDWFLKGENGLLLGAANLLLMQGWIPNVRYYWSFNSVSWSVSTEAFFYLVFPFLICRLDRSWWWKLLCTAAFVVAMLGLISIGLRPLDPANRYLTVIGLVYVSPLVRILEFFFGMAVASLCLRWRELTIVTSSNPLVWTILELFALSVTFLSGWYGPQLARSLFDGQSQYVLAYYAEHSGSFLAFGLLIGVLSFERGMVSRLLSIGWLVLLGEISYSIYLVHHILIRWYLANRGTFAPVPKTMLYIAYWLAVLSLSFIIWRMVEKPCQRWIRSLFGFRRDAFPGSHGAMSRTRSLPKNSLEAAILSVPGCPRDQSACETSAKIQELTD